MPPAPPINPKSRGSNVATTGVWLAPAMYPIAQPSNANPTEYQRIADDSVAGDCVSRLSAGSIVMPVWPPNLDSYCKASFNNTARRTLQVDLKKIMKQR